MTYVLEIGGQAALLSVRVAHFLTVMKSERVVVMRPDLSEKEVRWTGETEDGKIVVLRPVTEEDLT